MKDTKQARVPTKDQEREALKHNFEKATRKQPGEFKDESNEKKIVHIGSDKKDKPIKGIDP